ncbi:MAG: SAM-dependent chlorinase/fluorinase [bacterium]
MKIITFLSDFGEDDWFVAAVKGEISKVDPNIRVIDITHKIEPHDIRSAAFILSSVYANFPPGTVHLVVVDPGVGSKRKPIILESNRYFFVGPDNGVFSYIYDKKARAYSIDVNTKTSNTFHGRDIFGPVAAQIANGKMPPDFGREIHDIDKFKFPEVIQKADRLHGEVLYIDHFGNLITNISNDYKVKHMVIAGKKVLVKKFYSQGSGRQIICLKGSSGYYEIACYRGNAMQLLGVDIGGKLLAEVD